MEVIQDKRNYKAEGSKLKELIARLKKVKNIEIAIAVIALALVLLVYSGISAAVKNNADNSDTAGYEDADELEARLEGILSNIDGAGEVRVMITYDGSVEYVTANTTNTNTNTSTTGSGSSTTTSVTSSPVIVNNDGSSGPVIVKQIEPDIKGVIVVSEGAGNIGVRLELMKAVMTALDIGAENIEIFVMK